MSLFFWDLAERASTGIASFYDHIRAYNSTGFHRRTRKYCPRIKTSVRRWRNMRTLQALDLQIEEITPTHDMDEHQIHENEKYHRFVTDRRNQERLERLEQLSEVPTKLFTAVQELSKQHLQNTNLGAGAHTSTPHNAKIQQLESELEGLRKQMLLFMSSADLGGSTVAPLSPAPSAPPAAPAPPPPAPPLPEGGFSTSPFISRLKRRGSAPVVGSTTSGAPSRLSTPIHKVTFSPSDIISQAAKLKKSSQARSPGGTPCKQPSQSENVDPQGIIAQALKKKFQNIRPVSPLNKSSIQNDSAWDD